MPTQPMSFTRVTTLLVVMLTLSQVSQALYFNMNAGQTRCFFEELPPETLVMGNFKVEYADQAGNTYQPQVDANNPQGVLAIVFRDPSGNEVKAPNNELAGRFAFTSHTGGEHQVCLTSAAAGSRWFGSSSSIKVHFDLNVGDQAVDYKQLASTEHLSGKWGFIRGGLLNYTRCIGSVGRPNVRGVWWKEMQKEKKH
eukprot:TRINITY_DN969_c0_g1_i1.p1 TRINITY_DN969_c0_g1~~TRINITY_DN969_c0_g1_i1.p1  ORF type:complete len:197 (-),score=21.08 TRINITY_DN969_c0_g1_i1:410-1000(-)